MKSLSVIALSALAAAALVTSCAKKEQYSLNGKVDEKFNGTPVLLISFSSGDTIATDTVNEGVFSFVGEAPAPILAGVRVAGRSFGNVILEPGDIAMDSKGVSGTPLNDVLAGYNAKYTAVMEAINALENDSTAEEQAQAIYAEFQNYQDSIQNANLDNPVGAYFMVNNAYDMDAADIENKMNEHPSLKEYARLNKILDQKKVANETGVGMPYKDFEISYNGTTTKLSDLMQHGHYTLVDFWASWCGPCRREIPVLKEIAEEWGPKGLDVVGVAVWDEPQNTEKAMEELNIQWPVIINAQTIPTDMYGILGIPCIILIAPDGTIVSRGLQDQELKDSVAAAMTK